MHWFHVSDIPEGGRFVKSGCWDSIHVTEAKPQADKSCVYKLTTTVMLSMVVDRPELGQVNLSGNLTRQVGSCRLSFWLSFGLATSGVKGLGPTVVCYDNLVRGVVLGLHKIPTLREALPLATCRSRSPLVLTCCHVFLLLAFPYAVVFMVVTISVRRQTQQIVASVKPEDHIANLGTMIENMDTDLRSAMDSLYISKVSPNYHRRQHVLGG